ncbi:kinase domain-containing protein [Xylariomycetidae sp. FL0641]|nr:kinase domain-containing protein [Xylariomycetidae sp. FL0641]
MWWDAPLIEATVTRQFVCSHLPPDQIERLDQLAFGGDLTDKTYWEWINEKAKRIFLILLDLGVPEQIFGIVDTSWEDDDLPISLNQVERLALVSPKDGKLDKKFFARQFYYILKFIGRGDHVTYQIDEVVPITVVDRRHNSAAVDKVELPGLPGEVLSRRRFAIGGSGGGAGSMRSNEDLLYEISTCRTIQNEHLVSYYGSYTHQGYGYVLFTNASDYSLKTVLGGNALPGPLKALPKPDRRRLVLNWILCLADTLCYLHVRGRSHGNIKPSTVLFTAARHHHVSYADVSRLGAEGLAAAADDRAAFDKESYDYAAPEQWFRPSRSRKNTLTSTSPPTNGGGFAISRGATATENTATPHLNPQAADIFSLGCVILELISALLLKRASRNFASHRAAKHKTPGRGGAVPDSSFHQNLGQVESWIGMLARDAAAKHKKHSKSASSSSSSSSPSCEDANLLFGGGGVPALLRLAARMLAAPPHERPRAPAVQQACYAILTRGCGVAEPHCVHLYDGDVVVAPPRGETAAAAPGALGDPEEVGMGAGEYYEVAGRRDSASTSTASYYGGGGGGGGRTWGGGGGGGVGGGGDWGTGERPDVATSSSSSSGFQAIQGIRIQRPAKTGWEAEA